MLKHCKLPILLIIVAVTAIAVIQAPVIAAESKEAGAKALIESLGSQAVKILSDKSLSEEQKEQKFDQFLDADFDMPRIARFVLGRSWRGATKAQKTEFRAVFRNYMVSSYAQKIGTYSGENIKIIDSKSINDKESLVYTLIERPQGPPIKLDWRVRTNDGKQKIVDVIIEGVSMALTQRSEFASVVNNRGGVDGLISELKEKAKMASSN
ncbi:MAG: toluene tolerance protein [Sneathiella sp.]|nr:MAG: toluene tolerance protein [Sneathiella sp.]